MKEELSSEEKFVDGAGKLDKSILEIYYQFQISSENELIKLITDLNPYISLKKRYIRIFHDLFILTNEYVEKNGTLEVAQKFCESYYYRRYYLLLYYFLLVRMPFQELIEDEIFDFIDEIYEGNEPVKKLSEIDYECEIVDGKNYYYPSVGWDTIQYYAFMVAYREYKKWEEMPNLKKSTKGYQEIELIEEKLNIYANETKDSNGVYKLKLLISKQNKAKSEKSRKRLYGNKKFSKKKDYAEEFYLIDRYYDKLVENKQYSIKQYLIEEEITKTYFYKLKKEYFNQLSLKKYYQAYKHINSQKYDGNFDKVKEEFKISKRKMVSFTNRYFPKV